MLFFFSLPIEENFVATDSAHLIYMRRAIISLQQKSRHRAAERKIKHRISSSSSSSYVKVHTPHADGTRKKQQQHVKFSYLSRIIMAKGSAWKTMETTNSNEINRKQQTNDKESKSRNLREKKQPATCNSKQNANHRTNDRHGFCCCCCC